MSQDEIVSELEEQLRQEIQRIEQQQKQFNQQLQQALPSLTMWVPELWQSSAQGVSQQVYFHLSNVMYQQEQKPNTTSCLPGVILASDSLLEAIETINQAKIEFKVFMHTVRDVVGESHYRKLIHQYIHPLQWNLLQVFRLYPVYSKPVERFSVSWVIGDSAVKKLSAEQALAYAQRRLQNPDILARVQHTISTLRIEEFVTKKTISPHLQATLTFETGQRKKFKLHSPVFLAQSQLPITSKRPLPIEPPTQRQRAVRSDKKVLVEVYQGIQLFYYAD